MVPRANLVREAQEDTEDFFSVRNTLRISLTILLTQNLAIEKEKFQAARCTAGEEVPAGKVREQNLTDAMMIKLLWQADAKLN